MYYFTCTLFLISATITEMTTRCTTKIVHIIWTTISHFDGCWPFTAAWCPVKTHLPADLTVCCCWVSTIQPGGCISATSVIRWTWGWHSCAGWPLETKPARSDSTVTITATGVRNLSGITVKDSVILTFWYIKKWWFNFSKVRKSLNILICFVIYCFQKFYLLYRNRLKVGNFHVL